MTRRCAFVTFLLVLFVTTAARCADEPRISRDVEYARVGDTSLKLDLYVPANAVRPPTIVWVHGGAWRSGSKKDVPLLPLTERGFAIASVDYRLSPVAQF